MTNFNFVELIQIWNWKFLSLSFETFAFVLWTGKDGLVEFLDDIVGLFIAGCRPNIPFNSLKPITINSIHFFGWKWNCYFSCRYSLRSCRTIRIDPSTFPIPFPNAYPNQEISENESKLNFFFQNYFFKFTIFFFFFSN